MSHRGWTFSVGFNQSPIGEHLLPPEIGLRKAEFSQPNGDRTETARGNGIGELGPFLDWEMDTSSEPSHRRLCELLGDIPSVQSTT